MGRKSQVHPGNTLQRKFEITVAMNATKDIFNSIAGNEACGVTGKKKTMTKVTLTNASAGVLQDAWHYATLITRRQDSTFNGDREYPDGIRGQVRAYEHLLRKLDHMTADNETWELVRSQWWEPETFDQMLANAAMALEAINEAASRLGIDARTGEKPETM